MKERKQGEGGKTKKERSKEGGRKEGRKKEKRRGEMSGNKNIYLKQELTELDHYS